MRDDILGSINAFRMLLDQSDREAIRPLRAILSGNGTADDKQQLEKLEIEAQNFRQKINTLLEENQ